MMSLPYIRNIPAVQVMLRMRNTQSQIPLPLREGGALYRLQNARGRVAVFAGCTVDFLYPSYGRALIQSLLALRYDVVLPKGEVCCGAPLLSLGFRDDAVALAEKNVRLFRDLRVEAVISLCPTCVYYLRDVYRMLLGESVGSVMDDITFFANHQDRLMEKAHHLPVAYHASCHTRNMLKSDRAARTLLAAAGYESGSPQEGCCGFGETFSVLYDEMSASLRDKMLASYCNYNTIITSCPNCMLQFERGLNNTDKKIRHSIEIIHESLTGAKP
jgi:glycolate oxidase iron-sulfur subunit